MGPLLVSGAKIMKIQNLEFKIQNYFFKGATDNTNAITCKQKSGNRLVAAL
ncbi:MAG: hypothetical protein IJN98_03580 [Alistipes sp.]|nr:hypothetical protein [Alistipes sp.]